MDSHQCSRACNVSNIWNFHKVLMEPVDTLRLKSWCKIPSVFLDHPVVYVIWISGGGNVAAGSARL